MFAISLEARALEFEWACSRANDSERSELEARARLLVLNAEAAQRPALLRVVCTAEQSRWELEARPNRIPIDETDGLVDGALEALEVRLSEPQPTTEGNRSAPEPPAREGAERNDAQNFAHEQVDGGFGLGASAQLFEPLDAWALGPRLDFGLVWGPVALTMYESTLFASTTASPAGESTAGESTAAQYDLVLFNVGAGVSVGAPFDGEFPLGVRATVEAQWLAALEASDSPRVPTAFAPAVSMGFFGAQTFDHLAVWLGFDAAYRLGALQLAEPIARSLPSAYVGLSLGVVVLATSTKPASVIRVD